MKDDRSALHECPFNCKQVDDSLASIACESSKLLASVSPHAKAGVMASHIQNFVKGAKGLKLKELVPYTSKYSKEHLTYSKLQPQFKSSLDVIPCPFVVRKPCTSDLTSCDARLLVLVPVPPATDALTDRNDRCSDLMLTRDGLPRTCLYLLTHVLASAGIHKQVH